MKRKVLNYTSFVIVLVLLSFTPVTSNALGVDNSKTFTEEKPNIIFMIGDGMGFEQIEAASLVEYGAVNQTILNDFPVKDSYSTETVDGVTTDSAASGTALATGQKTEYGFVSMNKEETHNFKTILEYLEYDFGYSTGLVSTMHIAHATPAVFAAHSNDRDNYESIFPEMMSKDIDILLGAGLNMGQIGESGAQSAANDHGYETAFNVDELNQKLNSSDKLLGIFGHFGDEPNMPYEVDRDPSVDPSIIDMTTGAIDFLDKKDKPFFLMVEAGRIDNAGHLSAYNNETFAEKTTKNVIETIMFEKAIREAYEYAKNDDNTILVVGADHETGGLTVFDGNNLDDELPSEDNSRDENLEIRKKRALQLNLTWKWNAHSNIEVPFYGFGSDFQNHEIDDNTDVFWALNRALGDFPVALSYAFEEVGEDILVQSNVMDLDRSLQEYQIHVIPEGGEMQQYNYTVDMDTTEFSINETVTKPTSDSYQVYIHLMDNNQSSTNTFDNEDTLVRQSVSYNLDDPSETPGSDGGFLGSSTLIIVPLVLLFLLPILRKKSIKR